MWLAPGLVAVQEFLSEDGSYRFAIYRRPDGFFGYAREQLITEDGHTYWEPRGESGIHPTAEAAERDARAETPGFGTEKPA
jgi:hypothetical protein